MASWLTNTQYLAYSTKFGHLPPPIKNAELKSYEAKAGNGDIEAMLALYRYYNDPSSPEYNDFEDKAYNWLMKAIELGSEEAMLEKGFDRPYARTSSVRSAKLSASLTVNRDGIENSKANCFLYRLFISYPVPGEDYFTG